MTIKDDATDISGPENIDTDLLEKLLDSLIAEQTPTEKNTSQNLTNLLRKE